MDRLFTRIAAKMATWVGQPVSVIPAKAEI
jgi:hypothetical protein